MPEGLNDLYIVSGTAQDPDGSFRGFLTLAATGDDGTKLEGQLDPDDTRRLGLSFFEAAEAADQDAIVMAMLVDDIGLDVNTAGQFIRAMRDRRKGELSVDANAAPAEGTEEAQEWVYPERPNGQRKDADGS